MTQDEALAVMHDWRVWARPSQLAPEDDWFIWLIMTGRGWGKTRTGAEWIIEKAKLPNRRIALIGRTPGDARDVMIEGESGIMSISPPWNKPHYEPSKRRITWDNGSVATVFSSESPNALRGPSHHYAWGDELATWKTSKAFDNLMLGLRLENPQAVFTTTPRPINTVKEIVKDSKTDPGIIITYGKTYDNAANLSPVFMKQVIKKYKGTTLGQQELDGLLFEDLPGALWKRSTINKNRVEIPRTLSRVVVALDPTVTTSNESDECGIMIGGLGDNGHAYILRDDSERLSPLKWATKAVNAFHFFEADLIVGEVNNGGELVELTLKMVDPNIPYKSVHASRGKTARAEPVAALYEQGRVHHVGLTKEALEGFEDLEDQMCTFIEGESQDSPDRMDALVWLVYELMIRARTPRIRW